MRGSHEQREEGKRRQVSFIKLRVLDGPHLVQVPRPQLPRLGVPRSYGHDQRSSPSATPTAPPPACPQWRSSSTSGVSSREYRTNTGKYLEDLRLVPYDSAITLYTNFGAGGRFLGVPGLPAEGPGPPGG